jgi:antitoxin VapB
LTALNIGIDYAYTFMAREVIMQTITTKLFKNGQSQAVRIPKPFQFIGIDEVTIRRQGNSVIITPKRKSWASFADIGVADADFMNLRTEMIEPDRVVF